MCPILAHLIFFTCFVSSQFFLTRFLRSSLMFPTSCHIPVEGAMTFIPLSVSAQIHYYRSLKNTYQIEVAVLEQQQH